MPPGDNTGTTVGGEIQGSACFLEKSVLNFNHSIFVIVNVFSYTQVMGRNKGPKKKLVAFRISEESYERIELEAARQGMKPATLLALEQERKTAAANPEQVSYLITTRRDGKMNFHIGGSSELDAQFAQAEPHGFISHYIHMFTAEDEEPSLEPWNPSGADVIEIKIDQFFKDIKVDTKELQIDWRGAEELVAHGWRSSEPRDGKLTTMRPSQCVCTVGWHAAPTLIGHL